MNHEETVPLWARMGLGSGAQTPEHSSPFRVRARNGAFFFTFMSFYRNVFLKSDEWKSIRKERIWVDRFRCQLCGCRRSNKKDREGKRISGFHCFDVHHLSYRKLHNPPREVLRTLCRSCHQKVHDLMKKYPRLKSLSPKIQWTTVLYHLAPEKRLEAAKIILRGSGSGTAERKEQQLAAAHSLPAIRTRFGIARRYLRENHIIRCYRMPWLDRLAASQEIWQALDNPLALLNVYMALTGIDPRKMIPDIIRPLVFDIDSIISSAEAEVA